jgi:excisionase family DNA binding protein
MKLIINLTPEQEQAIYEQMIEQPKKIYEDDAPIGISEASKLLRLSESRVYVLSNEGKLPCHRRGGRLYFFRDEINNFIRSCDHSKKILRTKKK